ncbi:hypothetical protein EJ03DRAFT_331197 [Teratosphaeria nubilosa]|uniref:Lipocalin-like domain-containing protein n=1 Tax=Teratosphaeria nubilosa TaxID=161662 RepID=A0A6G1KYB2_9PEZI|nr:hypothetical protein EJ03DRAFT_331197 [Teratosphaeria nubilosa]
MPPNLWPKYADKLAGGWKCISFEVFDGTGPDKKLVGKPHGDEPLGRVLLSPTGFLSALMAVPQKINAPLPSGKSWQEAPDAEVANVARGLSCYAGYLQLFEDDEGLYWETKVDVATQPANMGSKQVRRVKYFEENGKAYMILQPVNDMVMLVSSICRMDRWSFE